MDLEREILNEVPYNWRKHFIYNLPEMLRYCFYAIILFLIIELTMTTIIVTAVSSSFEVSDQTTLEALVDSQK